jgi:hypothetical protein
VALSRVLSDKEGDGDTEGEDSRDYAGDRDQRVELGWLGRRLSEVQRERRGDQDEREGLDRAAADLGRSAR